MEVIMNPQVLNVKPVNSLQDKSKGWTVQTRVKSETNQGNHSPPLSKEATNDPDILLSELQDNLLEGLRWVSAVLGLLPWDAKEPETSFTARARVYITVLLVVIVGTTYIIIQSYVWPQYSLKAGLVALVVEITYSWCLTLTSWLIVTGFWFRRRIVPSFFQKCGQLRPAHPSVWPHVARVILVILPVIINFVISSSWYNKCKILPYTAPGVYFAYLVSNAWLYALQVMPIIYYLIIGQLILDSLVANNNALICALEETAGEMTLMEIHQKNAALRRLYGELEKVMSLPLLGCKIFITFIICDNIYFMVDREGGNEFSPNEFSGITNILLTLTRTGMMCRLADNIRDQAAAPMEILTTIGGTRSGDLHNCTWTLVPYQVTIYRLAERPFILKVGSLYPLSLTNLLSILSIVSTYIIILIQFNEAIGDPHSKK